jgi:transglutaminase-like putative cysteine protease
MILTVKHVTRYRYDAPMRSAVQSLRLFPARFAGQRVLDWNVEIKGGVRGGSFRDGAGDRIEGWSVRGPLTEVAVSVNGTVETEDMSGVLRGHREIVPPAVYLRDTLATQPDGPIRELAEAAIAGGSDDLERAHRLSEAVAAAVAFRPGVTHAHTSAAEALQLGEGVCQDHAHVLIAAARSVGLPARYVSGYLYATEDGSLHEAAHAWAEIHVADLGWVGFDAANSCCPNELYVRLGSGYDARDAAPIRGLALGAGAESLDVTVALDASQQ